VDLEILCGTKMMCEKDYYNIYDNHNTKGLCFVTIGINFVANPGSVINFINCKDVLI
jgi:hypothetical protein